MGPFLRGFCQELVKVGYSNGAPTPPPVPSSGPSAQTPAPATRFAPSQSAQGSIRPQTMNFDSVNKQPAYRASPTYTPKAGPEGADKEKSTGGGGKRGKGDNGLPFGQYARITSGPNAPQASTFKAGDKPVAPLGKAVDDNGKLRYSDKPELGVLEKGKRRAPNAKELTSSHVDPNDTRRTMQASDMTAKDWMNPNSSVTAIDGHSRKPTKRAIFESDHPRPKTFDDIRRGEKGGWAGGGGQAPAFRGPGMGSGGWGSGRNAWDKADADASNPDSIRKYMDGAAIASSRTVQPVGAKVKRGK